MFVQFASNAGHSDSVPGELKSFRGELRFRLGHSVPCLFCAAGFGDNDDERLWESLSNPAKNAIKIFRVGVVEEKDVHGIVWRVERG